MKKAALVLWGIVVAILGLSILPVSVLAQQVIFVVRHGEMIDGSLDSELSAEGQARALRLSTMLAATGLRSIYTTQYRRTQQLAAPIAKRLEIIPVIVPATDTATLLSKIRNGPKDEITLVVGHRNTVPSILIGLGYETEVIITDRDYDNFFVVVSHAGLRPVVTRLRF